MRTNTLCDTYENMTKSPKYTKFPNQDIFLISCSKKKLDRADRAENLYQSDLFKKSISVAQRNSQNYFILSAKHGLLHPSDKVQPYNLFLNSLSTAQRDAWGRSIVQKLSRQFPNPATIWILAGEKYVEPIRKHLDPEKYQLRTPLMGLGYGRRLSWLMNGPEQIDRERNIEKLYKLLEGKSRKAKPPTLFEAVKENELPNQGVYFFLDDAEPTRYSSVLPRIIRIGTHAVSTGSKAILRTRLRAHLGTEAGLGNHRGSVFRQHVGAALIEKNQFNNLYPNWGIGRNASKKIRLDETSLEREVSNYIRKLRLLFIEVPGEHGTDSYRDFIERNSLALLTQNMCPSELASKKWLGNWSPNKTIRRSGLWNIQHVGGKYEKSFLKVLHELIDAEINKNKTRGSKTETSFARGQQSTNSQICI